MDCETCAHLTLARWNGSEYVPADDADAKARVNLHRFCRAPATLKRWGKGHSAGVMLQRCGTKGGPAYKRGKS